MLQIVTDSSAEFTEEEARALGIRVVPLTVVFGDRAYLEGVDLGKEEFYARLPREFPHTSRPSEEQFLRVFEETKGEETIALLISSSLSGTTDTARLAKKDGGFDNVLVYETLCTTAMLRILVETAAQNRDKTAREVAAILDGLRPRLRLHAYVDTLDYLRRGGRLKRSVAIVGELLGIKPLVTVTREGTVAMEGRAHGRNKALKALAERYAADGADPRYPVYFLQTEPQEPARELMRMTGNEERPLLRICCAVGTHIGPNAAGIVYVAKEKTE